MVNLTQKCKTDFEAYLSKTYGYTLRNFNILHSDMQIGVYMAFFNMTGIKSISYKETLKAQNRAYNLKIYNQETATLADEITLEKPNKL